MGDKIRHINNLSSFFIPIPDLNSSLVVWIFLYQWSKNSFGLILLFFNSANLSKLLKIQVKLVSLVNYWSLGIAIKPPTSLVQLARKVSLQWFIEKRKKPFFHSNSSMSISCKGNRTIAGLRYGWEDSISPSTLNFVAIKGQLGIYSP